jgi:hypothetical protein
VSDQPVPLADVALEADRMVAAATDDGLTVRLLGGLGVAAHAHGPVAERLLRTYADIDVVTGPKDGKGTSRLLRGLGYEPNDRFNALHGARRMLFYDTANARQVDVFVGRFAMSHALDLSDRLRLHPTALAASDLLLTKLQVVELNAKDVVDALRLFVAHEVTPVETPSVAGGACALSSGRVVEVTQGDWGWYTTLTDNLAAVVESAPSYLDAAEADVVRVRADELLAAVRSSRKSARWKARSMVGRRMPWYELPEEVAGTGAPR